MEFKNLPAFTKGINGRTVTGICSVFGNVDEGFDRVWPGAFKKTLAERLSKVRFLWQHGADGWDYGVTPPIAKIDSARELSRDELPGSVLAYAPDATGGLEVTRTYLNTPRGDEVLAAYKADIHLEMSFAYDAVKYDFSTTGDRKIRELRELRAFDFSDVNWGMNSATVGSKAFARRLQLLVERLKSLDFHEMMAAELDDSLLEEFRALCAMFSGLKAKPGLQQQQAEQQEPSRAGETRNSLTPQLVELRQLELAMCDIA